MPHPVGIRCLHGVFGGLAKAASPGSASNPVTMQQARHGPHPLFPSPSRLLLLLLLLVILLLIVILPGLRKEANQEPDAEKTSSSARRITSTGASSPVHILKAIAPW